MALGALALAAIPVARVVGGTVLEALGEEGILPLAMTLEVLKVGGLGTCWGRVEDICVVVVLRFVLVGLVSHTPERGSSVAETDFFRRGVGAAAAAVVVTSVLVGDVDVIDTMLESGMEVSTSTTADVAAASAVGASSSADDDGGGGGGKSVSSKSTSSSKQNFSISAKSQSLKLAPLVSSLLPDRRVAKGLIPSPSPSESMANSANSLEFRLSMSSSCSVEGGA